MKAPTPNRRQVLGAVSAAAGAMAFAGRASAASVSERTKSCFVRVAAVSYVPPPHDHRRSGVNLQALREMTAKVARERPDFICYPEACACIGGGFEQGIDVAPDLDPYVAEVAKIAREFNTAIVAPLLERHDGRIYNTAPVVDRHGKLVLVYRKNYPTILELEAGITPGEEVPVGECDGVRVGATICFDANFDHLADKLQQQRARLVFWPSMYWGGQLLQHWALRYGFAVAIAYGAESAIIDMNGNYLVQQGASTNQVRKNHLPPWAVADIHINRELFYLDDNQEKFPALIEKYGPAITIEIKEPEGFFLLASNDPDTKVEAIAEEFGLETLGEYLARSVRLRNQHLKR